MSLRFTRGHRAAGSVCQRQGISLYPQSLLLCHFLCLAWLIHHFPPAHFPLLWHSFSFSPSRSFFSLPLVVPPFARWTFPSLICLPLSARSLHCALWPFMGSVQRAEPPSDRRARSRFPGFKLECNPAASISAEQQVGPQLRTHSGTGLQTPIITNYRFMEKPTFVTDNLNEKKQLETIHKFPRFSFSRLEHLRGLFFGFLGRPALTESPTSVALHPALLLKTSFKHPTTQRSCM